MDIISYASAAQANDRIEKINANPDSDSGIVTQPSVIATGESVTVPTGRIAVLPNLQIDGELVIDGDVFVPSGATVGDLEDQIALKADIATTYTKTEVDTINTWTANDSRAKTALNATGSAPMYACRAWVNFNGTGTVAIRASGNVSSITDNGVGDYTVNFTTAMADANYGVSATLQASIVANNLQIDINYPYATASSVRVACNSGTATAAYNDTPFVSVQIFR